MTTTTEEASICSSSSTLILYLSPSLHHVPHVSEGQETTIADNISQQLSVESVSCHVPPASSEPLQSYVVSPMLSTVQDTLKAADISVSAAINGQLLVTTECVTNVSPHCADYSDSSSLAQNGLNAEPAEEDVGQQPKVSNAFLA